MGGFALNLKLAEWASIAEIASSIAVVTTLIVLVIQVRDNTGAMQAATRESIAGRIERIAIEIATNPELAALIAKDTGFEQAVGASGKYSLAESIQMRALITALLRNAEEAFHQMQEGRLDEAYFKGRISALPAFIAAGGGSEIYCDLRAGGSLDSGFVERIDFLLTERYEQHSICQRIR